MGCRHNGLSELWAVGIMLRFPVLLGRRLECLLQVTDKLYHNNVVSSTPLLSEIRTHNFSGDRY